MVKPVSLRTAGVPLVHEYGKPRDTFYSRQGSLYLPDYAAVEHLVTSGKLVQVFGDFEASDKDAKTATPRDFAGLAFDLQGRLLARVHIPVMQPEHAVYALGAAMVGQIDAPSLQKGYAEHMAAAQIHDFFKQTARLDGVQLQLAQQRDAQDKLHYVYPLHLAGDDRRTLVLHEQGCKFQLEDGGKAQKIYGHWQPYNGEKYDDVLLAHWSARLGFASLFPSSRKKHDTIRSDLRVKAMWVWAFGPQGSSGLQLGERHHKRTRRTVLGTRLEDIIRNNTEAANRARGVPGGIRLYDGREFDPEKMHNSAYDTAATAALSFELRRLDPQGLRFLETMDDADKYKRFLQGNRGYSDRPPVGFVHYDQGMLTRGIGVLLATDDQFGDRRRALLFNLAHDPAEIMRLKNDQLRALLVQRNNEPVFVPVELNKSPVVADFARAYQAGAGHGLPPEEYHRRTQQIINNRAFIQRVMESWYELTSPAPPVRVLAQRAQHEDSFAHYGEPKYYVAPQPGGGYRREPKDIYKRRIQIWRTQNEFDRLLNQATEGHAVEYSDDPAAVTAYGERYADTVKKLAKLQKNWRQPFTLPGLPDKGLTIDTARRHLWQLREECMDARFNLYPDAWVVNERGQRQPWDKILAMPAATRKRLWPQHEDEVGGKPHFRIVYERNPVRSVINATVLAFTTDQFYQGTGRRLKPQWWDDYFAQRWGVARPWYEAYVTRAVQGPPNQDPSEQKVPSELSELKQGRDLQAGAAGERLADYAKLLTEPLGQQRFAAHLGYKAERVARHVWTPDKLDLMGYDPATKAPLPNPLFHVAPHRLRTLTVPDALLDPPPWHPLWGQHRIVARPDGAAAAALALLQTNQEQLLLVGAATGMFRLAARAVCARLPPGAEAADAVSAARALYGTADMKLGANPLLLTFEQLTPVHGARAVDMRQQHVALPAQEWAGLVDGRSGGLPTQLGVRTGILVRDVGQVFTAGPVRLRRQQAGQETGDEYSGVIAKATRIGVDALAGLSDTEAWRYGKLSAGDLYAGWRKLCAELAVPPAEQKLWRLELAAPVEKASYTYYNPAALPVAVFTAPPDPSLLLPARRSPEGAPRTPLAAGVPV